MSPAPGTEIHALGIEVHVTISSLDRGALDVVHGLVPAADRG